MKTILVSIACAATCLSVAPAAIAQSVAQTGAYKGDLADFHGNGRTLIKAIRTLEADGSRVVDIRFSPQNGLAGYHVVLQKDGRYTFAHFDEKDGRIVSLDTVNAPDWMLKWKNRTDLRVDRHAKVDLAQAVRTAEAAYDNAPAVAAGIAASASNPTSDVHAFNVILDRDGQPKRVAVDSVTGQIIANPGALASVD